MHRRFGAILIGLSLTLPVLAVAPASAHVGAGWSFEAGSLLNADGETVSGFITNHLSSRRQEIAITATWKDGDTVMAQISQPAMIDALAAHATSPFQIFKPAPVEASWDLSIAVTNSIVSSDVPVGGLSVQPGAFVGGGVYEGQITNDGAVTAQNVQVAGYRRATNVTDAAESATIASIAPGATATYSIAFDPDRPGDVEHLIANTTGDVPYLTSWNNFFGDLGDTSAEFVDAIAWMADEGITNGCGHASFCPKSPVTRAQMAVFLSRGLDLNDASTFGFTDIGTQSQAFQDAINALANAGVTNGCRTAPLRYCPTQSVTRGQMAKFIVEGFGDEGGKDLDPIAGPGPFTDDNGHFSEPYNNAMADAGVTLGCAAGKYCPDANVTREQMAAFMKRASDLPDAP